MGAPHGAPAAAAAPARCPRAGCAQTGRDNPGCEGFTALADAGEADGEVGNGAVRGRALAAIKHRARAQGRARGPRGAAGGRARPRHPLQELLGWDGLFSGHREGRKPGLSSKGPGGESGSAARAGGSRTGALPRAGDGARKVPTPRAPCSEQLCPVPKPGIPTRRGNAGNCAGSDHLSIAPHLCSLPRRDSITCTLVYDLTHSG